MELAGWPPGSKDGLSGKGSELGLWEKEEGMLDATFLKGFAFKGWVWLTKVV